MFAKGVSDDYLKKFGQKKYLERVAGGAKNVGTPNNYYNRKQTIKRYWDFKIAFKVLADLQKFEIPEENCWAKFYISMPESWSKKKKKEKQFTIHKSMPDEDNLWKSVKDSMLVKDEKIGDARVSKFWYDGKSFIEITLGELPIANGYTKYVREDKIK